MPAITQGICAKCAVDRHLMSSCVSLLQINKKQIIREGNLEMRNIFKQEISHVKKYKGPVIQRTAFYLVKNQRNQKNPITF